MFAPTLLHVWPPWYRKSVCAMIRMILQIEKTDLVPESEGEKHKYKTLQR